MTLWISGGSGSGKTTELVRSLQTWLEKSAVTAKTPTTLIQPTVLVLVANDDNRRDLQALIPAALLEQAPIAFKTPLGFVADEVLLFWPMLAQKLQISAQFPIRLRPETEQELATQLWQGSLERQDLAQEGIVEYRFIRDTLDLLQLAGAANVPLQEIAQRLAMGLTDDRWEHHPDTHRWRSRLLEDWWDWCLARGLLSYGMISTLYGQYLLGDPIYQQQLLRRYQAVFADDVQDYPALIGEMLRVLLAAHPYGTLTYNPQSCVRVGLNADPVALAALQSICTDSQTLDHPSGLAPMLAETAIELVFNPTHLQALPPTIQTIETITRAQLLRQTADHIVAAVKSEQIDPHDIAVIAPGLDAIARYSFMQILRDRDIPITPLNEQNPLNTSPLVRALLTLLPFIYDGLGDLLERERVAEMLIVLSQGLDPTSREAIDPVRAGLLAEHCYRFDVTQPQLQAVTTYARWDRLSQQVVRQYDQIRDWIEQMRTDCLQQGWPPPILLNRAIKRFLWQGGQLPYAELSALRGIMETAQHFWAVQQRRSQTETPPDPLRQFIQLLSYGTITANAYPVHPSDRPETQGVMLATIYQYRALRHRHRWHFWLDAGSPYWETAGTNRLYGADLFLEGWSGFPADEADTVQANQYRLEQVLRDLLSRVEEQVYLCHSDLAVNGLDQAGPLMNLVQGAISVEPNVSSSAT